jgi:hypothetical protein
MSVPTCAHCGNFIAGKVFTTLDPISNAKICRECHNEEVEMLEDVSE